MDGDPWITKEEATLSCHSDVVQHIHLRIVQELLVDTKGATSLKIDSHVTPVLQETASPSFEETMQSPQT